MNTNIKMDIIFQNMQIVGVGQLGGVLGSYKKDINFWPNFKKSRLWEKKFFIL